MNTSPASDADIVRQALSRTDALLLDFDGPVCNVFAGIPAHVVADQLRAILAGGGHTNLPPVVTESEDPFDVFRYAALLGPDEARYVQAAFTAHEVEAIPTAESTPGTHELMAAWHGTGRPLSIVSNNSAAAVNVYLDLYDLRRYVRHISARTNADASLLKPNPYLIMQACAALDVPPDAAIVVGDAITDIEAAHAAGSNAIGYANKPGKAQQLATVGADLITDTMSALLEHVIRA